jgi:hypothetical protein
MVRKLETMVALFKIKKTVLEPLNAKTQYISWQLRFSARAQPGRSEEVRPR